MTAQPETPAERAARASDILADHWALRRAPGSLRPYLRLARIDRPIGTWLLLFPCWWSLSLAASAGTRPPDLRLIGLFALGALVMRGAGCTYNDIVDRDFDAKVARTFNGFAVWLGLASMALVLAYPFMKRVTYWPQAWLGLTFNWGALLGWAAVTGGIAAPAVLLYLAGIAWTLGYDTIYAHQDKEDDALVGVKSTALRLGANTKPWLVLFFGLAILGLGAAGWAAALSWPFYLGLAGVAAQFAWQVASLDVDDPAGCLARFKSNRYAGWLLLAGIIAAGAIP
jgi:4-hydroxybenzoate polyprenyltransferase